MAEIQKNKPINVCFVSPKAYPLFNSTVKGVFGGAEVDLYLLATELAKDKDFEVSCITADYNQPEIEHIENVKIIKSLNFKQNQITGAAKIWKAMKKANARIYMLETLSLGVPLAGMFCRLHKRALIYRTASTRECNGTYLRQHPLLGRLIFHFLRTSNAVIVQNASDKNELLSNAKINSKVIPNGQRLPEHMTARKKSILWVGRSAHVKRPELFLELAKRLDVPFTMICQKATGDNNYQNLVAKAKQIENLTFIEQVPFAEIDTFFRDAKVLVNTSDSEGFPNTFIQAAKHATPIVSLNVNPDNFLEKHNCGIHAKGDMNQMVESLASLLEGGRLPELGQNARQYVRKYHDVEQIIAQYKNLFKEVCTCR